MSDISIGLFRIIVLAPVGVITEAKIKKLMEHGNGMQLIQSQPGVSAMIGDGKGTSVLIFQDQISYGYDGDGCVDFAKAQKILEETFNALLLDQNGRCSILIVSREKSKTGSAMNETASFLNDFENIKKDWNDLAGVGLRLFEKHENDVWEFKIEPFLGDDSFYHVECLANKNEEISMGEIVKFGEEIHSYFINRFSSIVSKYFIAK